MSVPAGHLPRLARLPCLRRRRGHPAQPAAQQAVKVTQITHGPLHHYFGYIGQSRTVPWSADGRYVLALQVPFQDRLPGTGDAADVCVIDTRSGYAVRVVDRTLGWNPSRARCSTGTRAPGDTVLLQRPRPGDGQDLHGPLRHQRRGGRGGRVREYRFEDTPVANGGVAQNGGYFTALNYARMARLRPVTGYRDAWDWTKGVARPPTTGSFAWTSARPEDACRVFCADEERASRTVENLDAGTSSSTTR